MKRGSGHPFEGFRVHLCLFGISGDVADLEQHHGRARDASPHDCGSVVQGARRCTYG